MTDPRVTLSLSTQPSGKSKGSAGKVQLVVNGVTFDLPPELGAAIRRACEQANPESLPPEMTTFQAAEFLGVSRQFVSKLLRQGKLPFRKVGTHHRIPLDALRRYRDSMFQRSATAARELTQLSQEMGLYDEALPQDRS
jgi:excisionase family DNA binding protein